MADVTRRCAFNMAALALLALVAPAGAYMGDDNRGPDLGECQDLQVEAGHKVAFRAYAEGYQVYRWNGTGWAFVAPEAVLFDDDGEVVGIHYAGPTWESLSGSTVVGTVLDAVHPGPGRHPVAAARGGVHRGAGHLPPGDLHPAGEHRGRAGPRLPRRLPRRGGGGAVRRRLLLLPGPR